MTNEEIKKIVENEMKNMRTDVIAEFHKKSTGLYIFFKTVHERDFYGKKWKEYAQIGGYAFHRIQKSDSIIKKLRNDRRLYN